MKEITGYILQFLLGNVSPDLKSAIAYTDDENVFDQYKLVIFPSPFFQKENYGKVEILPQLPLAEWEGSPLLFGRPEMEKRGDTIILYADVIASSYFLISRYEEYARPNCRDAHGRFPGKESLPCRAGFLHRPVVDEYGKSLRKLLRNIGLDVPEETPAGIRKIYLTHDVDKLAHYRNLRSTAGTVLRCFGNFKEACFALKTYVGGVKNDPWFTFPLLFKLNNTLRRKTGDNRCETIAFIKEGGGKRQEDKPLLDIMSKDFKRFFDLCRKNGVKFGLHPSYEAGGQPELVKKEKELLEKAINSEIRYSRHHFLRSREPRDMYALINAGITDDFTMGYADVAGFRLGTSRPVRWINPETQQLTSLVLHPLTVMEISLSDSRYMALNEEDAFAYAIKLIDETKKHNGDLTLLWHNTSVEKGKGYQRNLYERVVISLSPALS
ncbi:MAG: polysaccharide deacetylase family protein [Prevotellaceae bacterium]|jgi:hypothetical protein|nr:polysaccharide deacetylase family protein [Prevotellaceae bacterium]